jgi:hypothetical protein
MHIRNKKVLYLIIAIISLSLSRVIFTFINDPEGPNLLIVVALATPIFFFLSTLLIKFKKILKKHLIRIQCYT